MFGANGNAGVSGFTPGPTDIVPSVSVAQILGPLQNNGGPTQTHALVAGSPAIDAGDPGGCRENPPLIGWHGIIPDPAGNSEALLSRDQRGFSRNADGNDDGIARCDIGAVEFGAGSVAPGAWSIRRSSDGGSTVVGWGGGAQDIPLN